MDTIEDTSVLSTLDFDAALPCECGRNRNQCERGPAVVNARLKNVCPCNNNPHYQREGWVLLCQYHVEQGRNNQLRCGGCAAPGAYQLLKEMPL